MKRASIVSQGILLSLGNFTTHAKRESDIECSVCWYEGWELSLLKIKIYKTIIFPVVLYGCEAWSLTLREKSKLRVFWNTILRRIFGPQRDEIREWRRLHNEELHSLYRSPNIVRVIKSRRFRWAGRVARMEEGRSALKILTGTPTRKKTFREV